MEYKILYKDGRAKRAEMKTVHGTVQTPVFMNVGTVGAIKGAVSTDDLKEIGTQVELSNTYHLHVRTGDKLIKQFGGLHKFMNWDRPILTDSGGFQVFSLSGLRKIKEEGVYFNSHIDGRKIFMGPEESMQIQSNLGSTIAMAFDECPSSVASREYVQASVDRTTRWLERCREEMKRLNAQPDTVNREQPEDKPTYLMGVGTPANILEAVDRGVDFFDCVYPTRNGRHSHVYTNHGKMNLLNAKYELDKKPIEEGCGCPACRSYSRAYIRHLFKAKEMLGMRLCVLHNLYFYNKMMEEIRDAIEHHRYAEYKAAKLAGMMAGEEAK